MRESHFVSVPISEVRAHIDATNPYKGTSRDAWAGIGASFEKARWFKGTMWLDELPEVSPASAKDVRRYASHAKKAKAAFPAIVVLDKPDGYVILDGAHRVAAARTLGQSTIEAYVGLLE